MNTRPSLETIVGLYKAALQQKAEADFALARIRESIVRHGYTEAEVRKAAGIYPHVVRDAA